MNKKLIAIAALAVALVGCQQKAENTATAEPTNTANTETTQNNAQNAEQSDAVTSATHENIKVSVEDAVAKFKEAHSDAKLTSISLEADDNGAYFYEVKGTTDTEGYEVKIDPVTGEVSKDETGEKEDAVIDEASIAKITDLVSAAIQDAGRDKYYNTAWALKVEDGKEVVEVELHGHDVPELEYVYDAQTGELVSK